MAINCWPFDAAHTTTSVATDVVGGKNATLSNVTLLGSGPTTNLNNAGVFNGISRTDQTAAFEHSDFGVYPSNLGENQHCWHQANNCELPHL